MPEAVGVPLSPPTVDSANPAGKEPETRVHAYAGVPPVALRFALYAVFIVPVGSVAETICNGKAAITRLSEVVAT